MSEVALCVPGRVASGLTSIWREAREGALRRACTHLSGEEGATAVEYALIAGLIAAVLITALTDTGTSVRSLFETVASSIP